MIPAGMAIAVVDVDQAVRNRLAMQLGENATTFGSVAELRGRLLGHPVVAILGPSCAYGPELAAVEELVRVHREVGAILLSQELSTALLQQALRAGVRDVLGSPVDTAQLVAAVQRVAETLYVPSGGTTTEDPALQSGELGQVMTVFSTKGGAGKSVLAVNLAVSMAQRSERPVVLVDGNLQFGDIAVMLKLAPQHTIVDAVSSIQKLDASLLQSLLSVHESSGLYVLPAPLEPAFADQIGAEEMIRIIDLLRSFAGHVIVDTPAYFNDVVLGLIETSDDVVLVAGMDIPNIKNVKIGLQTMKLLNTPMEKIHLVLNRANSKVKLEIGEVEKTLGIKAEALIPSDVVVPQSVNKGTPVVQTAPKSGVSKSIEELAGHFLPSSARRR
ncbi:nucleotide-binding protein [Actinomarinicola tropica]|uniref:P-loop NTPase n=1 Tax=Actinomarinicola tropica TaxID=2789776 RepID=A0A5Q2RLM3_9ACTN|nr:P-loop NTPase [Actinomarinicola tropica]QGG95481.1 P-loop NTPase [Actinomarinicola tropica]